MSGTSEAFRLRNFLNDAQWERLQTWRAEQDAIVLKQQKEHNAALDADPSQSKTAKRFLKTTIVKDKDGRERPYYGVDGGAYSYIFTPTSIGTAVKARHNVTKDEIDLTEYDQW